MKRILLFLFMLLSFNFTKGEEAYYRAQYFAYKCIENGSWTKWSDWQESKVVVYVNTDSQVIQVFTEQEQRYIILGTEDEYTDRKGGTQVEFSVLDQDKDFGVIRFRIQDNGVAQLYVEFDNIMWVYSGLHKI